MTELALNLATLLVLAMGRLCASLQRVSVSAGPVYGGNLSLLVVASVCAAFTLYLATDRAAISGVAFLPLLPLLLFLCVLCTPGRSKPLAPPRAPGFLAWLCVLGYFAGLYSHLIPLSTGTEVTRALLGP